MINNNKKICEFYQKISAILEISNVNIYNEFNQVIEEERPQEVYLWLDKKKEAEELPHEVIKIMPDFFGWIM